MQGSECEIEGGFYYGAGSTCDNEGIDCNNDPYGACCLGDICKTFYDFDCYFSGGIWNEGECADQFCVECVSDIDQDGQTNVNDLLAIIAAWGIDCDGCSEDVNNDADVNVADLLIVIGEWGPCE